jgi:predicted transcriptional regulator
VRLRDDLHERLHRHAERSGRDVDDHVNEALERYLQAEGTEAFTEPFVRPPTL